MADWPPLYVDPEAVDPAHLDLERAVVGLLLAGDDPVLEILRAQHAGARAIRRMFSGVGFVTDFALPPDVPAAIEAKSLFFLSDVGADLNGRAEAAGFHIQVKNGRLKLLEGFAYAEMWPSSLQSFTTRYRYPPSLLAKYPEAGGNVRAMEFVGAQWRKS